MQQQHATPTTTTSTDQLRISMGVVGVHDAAITATCIRAWKEIELCALMEVAMIAAIVLQILCLHTT